MHEPTEQEQREMDAFINDVLEVAGAHLEGKPEGRQLGLLITLGSAAFTIFANRTSGAEALKAFGGMLAQYAGEVPGASVTIEEKGEALH